MFCHISFIHFFINMSVMNILKPLQCICESVNHRNYHSVFLNAYKWYRACWDFSEIACKSFQSKSPYFLWKLCNKMLYFQKPQDQGLVSLGCSNVIRVRNRPLLGLKLNWVKKLAWKGEKVMSDLNRITLPWVLLAAEEAAFLQQLLRCMFLFSLSFCYCWLILTTSCFLVAVTVKDT